MASGYGLEALIVFDGRSSEFGFGASRQGSDPRRITGTFERGDDTTARKQEDASCS
jgi:hypothetical protein